MKFKDFMLRKENYEQKGLGEEKVGINWRRNFR
jgi:hypothetical protein